MNASPFCIPEPESCPDEPFPCPPSSSHRLAPTLGSSGTAATDRFVKPSMMPTQVDSGQKYFSAPLPPSGMFGGGTVRAVSGMGAWATSPLAPIDSGRFRDLVGGGLLVAKLRREAGDDEVEA